ncbi:uncharacterized protein [Macrobrachium rosenbergii]|uniref:uncharacterized protein n=1 Tax=Macrobrachium rosenbergii TaxID=79674 RepID=UPI0034D42F48
MIDSPKPLRNFLRLPLHLLQRRTPTSSSNSNPADDPGGQPVSKVSVASIEEVSSAELKTSGEETAGSLFAPLSSFLSSIDFPILDFSDLDLPTLFSSRSQVTTPAPVVSNSSQYYPKEQIPGPGESIVQAPSIKNSNNRKRHIAEKSSSSESLAFSRNKLVLMDDLPRGTVISVHKPSTFLSSLASGGPIVLDDQTEIRNIDISAISETRLSNPVFTPLSHNVVQNPISSSSHITNEGDPSRVQGYVPNSLGFSHQINPIISFPSYAEHLVTSTGHYPPGTPFAPSMPPQVGNAQHYVNSKPLPNEPQSYDMLPPSYEMVPPPPIPGYASQNKTKQIQPQEAKFDMKNVEDILESILCECENDEQGGGEGNCNCDEHHNLVLVFPPEPMKPYMFVPLKTIPEQFSSKPIPPVLFREQVLKIEDFGGVKQDKGAAQKEQEKGTDDLSPEVEVGTAFSAPNSPDKDFEPDVEESVVITESESLHKLLESTQQTYGTTLSSGDSLIPVVASESSSFIAHSYAPHVYSQPVPYFIHHKPVRGAIKPAHSGYKASKASWPSKYELLKSFIPLLKAPLKKAMKALSALEGTSSEHVYTEVPQPYVIPRPYQHVYQTPVPFQQIYHAPLSGHSTYQDSGLAHHAYETLGSIQQPYQAPVYHAQGDFDSAQAPQEFTQHAVLYSDMLHQLQEIQEIIKQNYKISQPIQSEYEELVSAQEIYSGPEPPIQEYGTPLVSEQPVQEYGIPSVPELPVQEYGIPSVPEQPVQEYGTLSVPKQPAQEYEIPLAAKDITYKEESIALAPAIIEREKVASVPSGQIPLPRSPVNNFPQSTLTHTFSFSFPKNQKDESVELASDEIPSLEIDSQESVLSLPSGPANNFPTSTSSHTFSFSFPKHQKDKSVELTSDAIPSLEIGSQESAHEEFPIQEFTFTETSLEDGSENFFSSPVASVFISDISSDFPLDDDLSIENLSQELLSAEALPGIPLIPVDHRTASGVILDNLQPLHIITH